MSNEFLAFLDEVADAEEGSYPIVPLKVPVQFPRKGGGWREGEFTANVKLVPQDVIDEWFEDGIRKSEFVREVVDSVTQIGKDPETPLDPEKAMDMVMKNPICVAGIFEAYQRELMSTEAERKNSGGRRKYSRNKKRRKS